VFGCIQVLFVSTGIHFLMLDMHAKALEIVK